jgi:hypothetical protein
LKEGVTEGKNCLKGEATKSLNLPEEGVTEGWNSLMKLIIIMNCLKKEVKKSRSHLGEGVTKSRNCLEEGVIKARICHEEEAAEGKLRIK